jgi:flagellar biosynthesis/type III secretory pathway M-ring protein FliF/YscJ
VTDLRVNEEMIELFILVAVIACIVWIIWRARTKRRRAKEAVRKAAEAEKKAALNHAWDVVLSDPNYIHRRRYEERMRDDEAQARKEEGL